MRSLKALWLVAVPCFAAFAEAPAQRGVEVGDIDRKVDPCTDFYEFANGAWRASNPIPPSQPRWSRRWAAGEKSKEQLRDILEDVSRNPNWPAGSVEQLIADHYGACMNEARVNELGLEPLKPMLAQIEAIRSKADLERMIRQFHHVAIMVPFALSASPDNHNPTQMIADLSASGLGLPDRDYYLKPEPRFREARKKYLAHIENMFKLAGSPAPEAKATAAEVFEMEKQLAEASFDNVTLRDPQATDHKTRFSELQKLAPRFDWAAYFQDAKLPRADLNVEEPKFLHEFDRQLGATPLPRWKRYLTWHLLRSAAQSLSAPFVEESFNFSQRYLSGAQEMKPRWKRCVESTDHLLGEALGRKYVEKHFPPAAKARMQDLVKNLLLAMKDTLQGLDWMGPETKKQALEKLATFHPRIGYPDKWKDYSKVKITRDAYWADVLAGRRFLVDDDRQTIGKPVDRERWDMTPPTSDASYNPLLNVITFPAGILQPPAFSMEVADAVNYGSIGVVIGHEISHGFDDEGAQFDAQGRLRNWWTAEDLARFQDRGRCVVQQYEDYFIEPTIHHNGKLVLGESIGDQAGTRIAYLAFKKSQQGKPPAPTIDGFTPDQQFFIAWGQFRGDATRPEMQRLMVQSDPHPVSKFRVIGAVSNMPEFQRAFSCKDGAPMVRPAEKRCQVW